MKSSTIWIRCSLSFEAEMKCQNFAFSSWNSFRQDCCFSCFSNFNSFGSKVNQQILLFLCRKLRTQNSNFTETPHLMLKTRRISIYNLLEILVNYVKLMLLNMAGFTSHFMMKTSLAILGNRIDFILCWAKYCWLSHIWSWGTNCFQG